MPTPLREINSLEFVGLLIKEENNDLSVPALMGISSLWHPLDGKTVVTACFFNREKNVCEGIVNPFAGLMDADDPEGPGLVFRLLSLTTH